MPELYQVVYTGRLKPRVSPEQAARDFAAVFKVPDEKAWGLVQGGAEHVLKKDIDEPNAERYRQVLDEIGLEVRVERSGTPVKPVAGSTGYGHDPIPAATAGGFALGAGNAAALDPYAPPTADLTPPVEAIGSGAMTGPHKMPAGHGWQWISHAYRMFRERPWPWIGAVALVYFINFLIGLVPFIGSFVGILLGPIFAGGLMIGARLQEQGGAPGAGTAFAGFGPRAGQLALVGLFYLLALIAAVIVAGVLAMLLGGITPQTLEALSGGDAQALDAQMGRGIVLFVLLIMAVTIPLAMAYWFAPTLVALEGQEAIAAMQASFRACLRNIVPFLIYGLSLLLVVIGGSILIGIVVALLAGLIGQLSEALAAVLAVVLLIPLMLAFASVIVLSMYTGFRDIFFSHGAHRHGAVF